MRDYFLLLLLIISFSSCKNKGDVEIVSTNLDNQNSLHGYLSFEFNKPMVSDTGVLQWQDNSLINIEPEVSGRIRWSSPTNLEFHPLEQFKPATTYKIRLEKDILKHYNYKGFNTEPEFVFSTPDLKLEQVLAHWEEANGELELHTALLFNYPISLDEATKFLELSLDGETVSWTPSITSATTVEGIIKTVEAVDKDRQLTVVLKKGAVPASGQNALKDPQTMGFLVLSPFKLEVINVSTEHNGVTGSIEISFSQATAEQDLASFISLEPEAAIEVTSAGRILVLSSDEFDAEKTYSLQLHKGLKGALGGVLRNDYTQDLSFGELEPDIRFTNRKALYLGSRGNKNIEVQIVNVPEVEVKVYKIYPNNIQTYLRNGYYNEYWDDEYSNRYYRGDNIQPGEMGDVVFSARIHSDSLPVLGSARLFNFNFEDALPGYEGLMVLELRSADDYWNWASKMVAFSDIGLIAKAGAKSITVFANSIKSAVPLKKVDITVLGINNQKIGTGKTDAQGVARIDLSAPNLENFAPGLVLAQNGEDFSFLALDRTDIQTSRFDVGGYRQDDAAYHIYTYGERDIYRPGETINLVTIVRSNDMTVPQGLPYTVVVQGPDGRELSRYLKQTNKQGSFEINYATQQTAMTGRYNVQVLGPTGLFLGSYGVSVEEFVPHRIKTTVRLIPEEPNAGDEVTLRIEAVNLFGPPAANRNYQASFNLRKDHFSPKGYEEFSFEVAKTEGDFREVVVEGKTNAAGVAEENFAIKDSYKNMGMLRLDAYTTVFDETGRPVNQLITTRVATQPVFWGIKSSGSYFDVGRPVSFDLAAVNSAGKAMPATAKVQLIKIEYRTVLSRSGGYFRYNSERSESVVHEKPITVQGAGRIAFTPESSGAYEIRVFAENSTTYVSASFYAYGYGFTGNQSFMVNNEGRVSFKTDKEVYAPGDKARILFTTPFDGTLLVTVEQDNVLEYKYLTTSNKAAEMSLDISEAYLPNVYLSAVLFRPHLNDGMPLTVAHGFYPLLVEKPSNKLNVQISAAKKTGSATSQTIKVKTAPGAWVSIAAVDEGILQVSGFETPDPYQEFYQKRALGVRTSDVYPYLFPEVSSRQFLRGGGAGQAKRLNPLGNRRFELLSYWSGLIQADRNGEALYKIEIPHFSGQLRVMAVAHLNKAFGSTEETIVIADPLVVSTAFPRFLSPNDKIEVPLTVTNTTSKTITAGVDVVASGPIKLVGPEIPKTTIQAGAEIQVPLQFEAGDGMGKARLKVTVSGDKSYTQTINFNVRPASPLQQRSGYATIKPGTKEELVIDTKGFISTGMHYEILVTANPLAGIAGKLQDLLHYPHGCTEQTTATAFPQIYFADLTTQLSGKNRQQAEANVAAAIEKLKAAQLYDGSFTYWPGEGTPNWWGTVFATHFLHEAQEAGYEVPQKVLDNAANYLLMRLQNRELVDYYYSDSRKYAPREVAYSLFVLAAMQKSATSMMNYYRSNTTLLTDDAKILLAAAYALSGNESVASELLPSDPNLKSAQESGGSFASTTRNLALSAYVLLKADKDNGAIPGLVRQLSENLKSAEYMNTQETAFSTLALGLYARQTSQGTPSGTVTANGRNVASVGKNNVRLTRADLKSAEVTVENSGETPLYVFWQSEGISKDGSFVREDKFLSVRRNLYTRSGAPVSSASFDQNDLVVVRIALKSLTGNTVQNIAISDLLPAGFEIENSRITDNPDLAWIKDRTVPQYADIRDDRINLYDAATPETKYYYYMVRAVTKGEFVYGPVAAEAMYNGSIHSTSGGGKVVVR